MEQIENTISEIKDKVEELEQSVKARIFKIAKKKQ
jgi:hypothetical protein